MIDKNKNEEYYKRNMKKILVILFIGIFLFSISLISAQEVSYCCEKTVSGAYCQNAPINECDPNFKAAATSCESTSYCQKGCCYDSDEGVCSENTPEEACKAVNGLWSDDPSCTQTPQCNLGCCIVGREASYTTLARCNQISQQYGVERDFRTDVADEVSCIALATSQDLGACVFERDFVNTCKFTTRGECNSQILGEGLTNGTNIRFYDDFLCTAQELNTDCGRSTSTMCDTDGKVYFQDTCGNRANIYDADKATNIAYWNKIVSSDESCDGNPRNCGNCEYLGVGSFCGLAERGENPRYGDYICQDVNCDSSETSDGKDHRNGESWCSYDTSGNPNTDTVGSRHFRHICIMGEEVVESCGDLRSEVCVESSIGEEEDFSQAGCVVNRWEDCVLQNSTDDCLNFDQRDCQWIPVPESINYYGKDGVCVPKVAPGLEFWDDTGASEQCSIASQTCVVKYEKGLFGERKAVENEFCLEEATQAAAKLYCTSIGDCGPDFNYIGKFSNKGFEITTEESEDGEVAKEIYEESSKPAPANANPQTFGGSQGTTFGGSQAAQAAQGNSQPAPDATGNVIQGLIVKSYEQIVGK